MIAGNKKNRVDINKRFFSAVMLDMAQVPNLILRHYRDLGLKAEECIALLHVLAAHPKDSDSFCRQDVALYLENNEEMAKQDINLLLRKGCLTVLEDEKAGYYSLDTFYDKMKEMWAFLNAKPQEKSTVEGKKVTIAKPSAALSQTCIMFERELGRPLSPVEGEKLAFWLVEDGWNSDMLAEALRRAVLYGSCNFAYISRILESWQKKGIRTLEAAQQETKTPSRGKTVAKKGGSGNDYDSVLNR